MNDSTFLSDLIRILDQLKESARAYAPQLFGAAVILLLGLALAWLVKRLTLRLLSRAHGLLPNRRLQHEVRELLEERPVGRVVAGFLYWTIVALAITAATETLGLPIVTTWIGGLVGYLPRVVTGVLIVVAGMVGGLMVKELVTTAGTTARIAYAATLGRMGQVLIVLVSVLVGMDQVGIDVSLLQGIVMITMGALLLGMALAFGLGAQRSVANILASHHIQKRYTPGDRVEIESRVGTIVEIGVHEVILDTPEGQWAIPAGLFNTCSSRKLPPEPVA